MYVPVGGGRTTTNEMRALNTLALADLLSTESDENSTYFSGQLLLLLLYLLVLHGARSLP